MTNEELMAVNDEALEKALDEAFKRYFATDPNSKERENAVADIRALSEIRTKKAEVMAHAATESNRLEVDKKQGRVKLVIEGLKVAATVGLTVLGIRASNNQLAACARFETENVWSTQTAKNRLQLPKIDWSWLKH